MSVETSKRILINEDGMIVEEVTSSNVVCGFNSLLESYFKKNGILLINVFDNTSFNVGANGNMSVYSRLDYIKFNAEFRLRSDSTDNTFMYPSFRKSKSSILYLSSWRVPDGLEVFFVSHIAGCIVKNCYLIFIDVRDPDNTMMFLPPLPNVYSDSRICIGSNSEMKGGIIDISRNVLNQFQSSEWNTDLYTNYVETFAERMFRFDTNMNQIEMDKDCISQMTRVSTPHDNNIEKIIKRMRLCGTLGVHPKKDQQDLVKEQEAA